MAAVELRTRGVADPEATVVTPEAHPLEIFGATAAGAVTALLDERGIALRTGCAPVALKDGALHTSDGREIRADRAIALPEAAGPFLPGLPHDGLGFLPTDAHGLVTGCTDVYAAGDATAFP